MSLQKTGSEKTSRVRRSVKMAHIAKSLVEGVELLYVILLDVVTRVFLSLVPLSMRRRKDISDDIVLITGGGSGFGRLMCLKFASLGCRIVIWDVDQTGAEETRRLVTREGGQAVSYHVDVSNRAKVYEAAKSVKAEVGQVSILVNNAGVTTSEFLLDTADSQIEKVMAVNTMAHFWTIKAFLSDMMDSNKGHIVCISSLAGFAGLPKAASYSASKHALLGLMDALNNEILYKGKDGVKTTVVCPYFSNTGFCSVQLNNFFPMVRPEYIVKDIVDGVLLEKDVVYAPKRLFFIRLYSVIISRKCKWLLQYFMSADKSLNSAKALKPTTQLLN